MVSTGKLYICGTPLGNLADITIRTIETLKKVDLIAAEDTRRSQKLLNEYRINTPLTGYHEHNEHQKSPKLLAKIKKGKNLALISDAGMPGISDPGYELIKSAIMATIEVIPVPGPTAIISALVVSGLSPDRFVFEGFLPRKGKERQARLRQIQRDERTIVIYESPYRLKDTLKDLTPLLAERKLAVIRELTKIHEEKIYGSCVEISRQIKGKEIKGEIVVVIEGLSESVREKPAWEDLNIKEHVKLLMKNGYPKKDAIKIVARERDLSRNQVYKKAIAVDARQYDK